MQEGNVYVIDGEAGLGRDEGKGEQRGKNGARKKAPKRARARGAEARAAEARNGAPLAAGAHGGWPRLAASCSMLVSGSGHFLHGRWKTGAAYLAVPCLAAGLHGLLGAYWSGISGFAARFGLDEPDLLFGLLLIDVLVVAVLLAGVWTSYALGRACSGDLREPRPHPAAPALASLLVPGWGQIINGQPLKSLAFLGKTYAGLLALAAWWLIPAPIDRLLSGLSDALPPGLVLSGFAAAALMVWAVSLYDAILVARHRRLLPSSRGAATSVPTRKGPRRAARPVPPRAARQGPVATTRPIRLGSR